MDLQEMKARYQGRHVQYVGMSGNTHGPTAKVWRVTKTGIWVTMTDGTRQQWHPEDIRVISGQNVTPDA